MNQSIMDNNLIQQLLVIGVSSDFVYSSAMQLIKKKLTKSADFRPQIVSKFPNFSHSYLNIPLEVIKHQCFPNGFSIVNSEICPPPQKIFFEIDNYPLNSKFKKIYFSGLIVFESLKNYKLLKKEKEAKALFPQKKFEKEVNLGNSTGSEISTSDLKIENSFSEEKLDNTKYIPKAILVASVLFFPKETSELISTICSFLQRPNTTIENVFENIIYDIPIPTKGKYSFIYELNEKKFDFSLLPINRLQIPSIEYNIIFDKFKTNDVLFIFKCILYEIPVLFFSESKEYLSTFVYGFLYLIYPFKYQYPYTPILPNNSYSLIEIFDSFVVGINETYFSDFFDTNNLAVDDKIILVIDIDRSKMISKRCPIENISSLALQEFPKRKKIQKLNYIFSNSDLPTHYKKKITDIINKHYKSLKDSAQIKDEDKRRFAKEICETFFYFHLSVFSDYSKYIKCSSNELQILNLALFNKKTTFDINTIFNCRGFLSNHTGVDNDFYRRIIETELFKTFLIKKIYPKTPEEKMLMLFYDEKISEKLNKSFFNKNVRTPLLETSSFFQTKVIQIPKVKSISDTEKAMLSIPENQAKALDNFQIITGTHENNSLSFSYPLFPKLLYEEGFSEMKTIQRYRSGSLSRPDKREDIKALFNSFLNNSKRFEVYRDTNYNLDLYESNSIEKMLKNDNYINLIWIIVASLSFHSLEKCLRNQLFEEIIDFLSTDNYIDKEALGTLYNAVYLYGSDEQLIILYDHLLKYPSLNKKYIFFAMLTQKLSKTFSSSGPRKVNTMTSRMTILLKESTEILNQSHDSDGYTNLKPPMDIAFEIQIECPNCKELFKPDFMFNGEKYIGTEPPDCQYQCEKCLKPYTPKIKVGINKKHCQCFNVFTPFDFYKKIREKILTKVDFILNLKKFKKEENDLFWNCVFFFSFCEKSVDFLVSEAFEE